MRGGWVLPAVVLLSCMTAGGCSSADEGAEIERVLREAGDISAVQKFFDTNIDGGTAVRVEHTTVTKDSSGAWKATVEVSLPVVGQARVAVERILSIVMKDSRQAGSSPRDMELLNKAAGIAAEEQRILTSVIDAGLQDRGRVQVLTGDRTTCAVLPVEPSGNVEMVSCSNWTGTRLTDEVAYEVRERSGEAYINGAGWVDRDGTGRWVKDRSITQERYMDLILCPEECLGGVSGLNPVLEREADGTVRKITVPGKTVNIEARVGYDEISGIDIGLREESGQASTPVGAGEINDTTPASRQAELIGRRIGDTLLGEGELDLATLQEVAGRAPGEVSVLRIEGEGTRSFDASITAVGERFCVRVVMLVDPRTGAARSRAQARAGSC